MSNIPQIKQGEFESAVVQSPTPVLVDFYADWCPPCRAMGPAIESVAQSNEGKLKVVKVNVDENSDLAAKYEIFSIPTFVAIKGGKEVGRHVGMTSPAGLTKLAGVA